MNCSSEHEIVRMIKGRRETLPRQVVEEFPLRIRVNGCDLATLICSPHKLNYLVAGFLHVQGLAGSLNDILAIGVCDDFGLAEIHLKNALPEKLQPTLTSGCGTGITFNLPQSFPKRISHRNRSYSSDSLFLLMRQLAQKADKYRSHGGIHSAAIGDKDGLLFHAEDIGRHNTLDRLAGEALFRGVDLRDKMLLTSGRISTEMVAKAVRIGIGLLASRSSPTNRAIELCDQAGITLVGYLRGDSLEIYSHPEQIQTPVGSQRIPGVSGVILAGGENRRMGSDKSLLPLNGARLIDHIYSKMSEIFEEVIIATNSGDLYKDIPCNKVSDVYDGMGPLAGIHSGLKHASNDRIFVVACDMPFISREVIRNICSHIGSGDVLLPLTHQGHEPLHALYEKSCLPAIEKVVDMGEKRISSIFDIVKVNEISFQDISNESSDEKSFLNINSPEDYFRLRDINTCRK